MHMDTEIFVRTRTVIDGQDERIVEGYCTLGQALWAILPLMKIHGEVMEEMADRASQLVDQLQAGELAQALLIEDHTDTEYRSVEIALADFALAA